MTTSKLQKMPLRHQNDWYSAARQSERDLLRMGWARHVLEEETKRPLTHSSARVRLAQNIVAKLQIGTVRQKDYEERTGGEDLAIPRKGNVSNGLKFGLTQPLTDKPFDPVCVETRAR